jgi:hypothetical protein
MAQLSRRFSRLQVRSFAKLAIFCAKPGMTANAGGSTSAKRLTLARGFETPPRATEGLSQTLVAVNVLCDECRWNYKDYESRGPGFESRRLHCF